LLLLLADRVDAFEHHVASLGTRRPDNPITETGVLAEFTRRGMSSRLGRRRADVAHQIMDPLIVAGPWIAAGVVGYELFRWLRSATPATLKDRSW
jgi:hypothetical protein